ncbi:helix-turn-helix domain-containing protein [Mucilaginibacter sp. SJ]|uniref:helix-turn-helix domain-containing protein n=1 Tax=Mucilaginibacter sp. SJ TaxID=3029053 RepID=UPI0023A9634A|nr:helix-turn-helix transcriptional regulator [Mucilaginibacter sp. SJ]WEA02915.1 helix-turn-helix transcriptional regulator [Mucilaginibacter sp. SJ]
MSKPIKFTVEKTNTGFSAYAEINGGGIAATTGENLNELKENALEAYNALAAEMAKKEVDINDIKLVYDIPQFFEFYKVINASQLAGRIKINRGLLSQYINGNKIPSDEQARKILQGVNALGRELAEVEFF